ncbi:MAG: hypothetical protein O9273_08505, partial [Acetobacteraceae bacterium]|nr:hypothetical protein [Acetobacteraceae bacterium]
DSEDHISLMSSGNVGIGTREPRAKLEIAGNIRVGDLAMGPWPGNSAYAFLGSAQQNQMDGGNYGLLFGVTANVGTTFLNGSTQIAFRIRNADQMRLTSEGNFGIGTVTPRAKLEVVGPARIGDVAMGPWPTNPGNYVFLGSALMNQAQQENYGLLFGTNAEQGNTYLNAANVVGIRIGNQQRLMLERNTLTVTARLVAHNQQDWRYPNLRSGWSNWEQGYAPVSFMKDSLGFVHLRGLVKGGTANLIFELPTGFRPALTHVHCVNFDAERFGRVDVMNDGKVTRFSGGNTWVSLDGITFKAEELMPIQTLNLIYTESINLSRRLSISGITGYRVLGPNGSFSDSDPND